MRFGSTAKVLLKCKLKYYRISECPGANDSRAWGKNVVTGETVFGRSIESADAGQLNSWVNSLG